MHHAVNLTRNVGSPGKYDAVVLASPLFGIAVATGMFAVFVVGTIPLVRRGENRQGPAPDPGGSPRV